MGRDILHNKGQLTIEFMTYIGIVLFIVVLASYASVNAGKDIADENDQTDARRVATQIAHEINTAVEIGDGYYHYFALPEFLQSAKNYTANITGGRFVTVAWSDGAYSLPTLVTNITGTVKKGENLIKNENGVIFFE